MSDLIEREAALCPKFTWSGRWNRRTIKIITEVMNKYGEYLAGLPSAQPERKEGRWIPVKERLPEDGQICLVTDGKRVSVERYKVDIIDHFWPSPRWFNVDKMVAWMPLPEPYKGGDAE